MELHVALVLVLCRVAVGSIVTTEYGDVSGHFINVDNGRDPATSVEVFHAVPFAADTGGQNRFASPARRTPWTGVYEASELGYACPQSESGVVRYTHRNWTKWGEDCLNVNIYTKDVSGSYPVMLWFYGGGFSSGANFQYPGHFYAAMDVVVVTANYRLNKFGYAYSGGDGVVPGNAGLWDQNEALKWTINNIAAFGGDPSRITLFGQSAGGASSAFHTISPASKDLFQQAILMSGTDTMPWAVRLNPEDNVADFAASLGCQGANTTASVECMRGRTWQDIWENGSCSGCSPLVDGPGGFLPEAPADLRASGNVMSGPVMAGITHDECSTFMVAIVPEALFGCCNRSYYERVLMNRYVRTILFGADNETQEEVAQALDYNYSPWPYVYDNYQNRDSLESIMTDAAFGYGWDYAVKAQAEVGPTWAYIYNFRGRNSTQLFPEWMGVPHIGEIPYVWGYPLLPMNPEVLADSEIQFEAIDWTDEDIQHALFAIDLWTNFAKFGDPTPTPIPNPLGTTTFWPQFTWDDMNVMEIKNTSQQVVDGWIQKDYAFWTRYIPYMVSDMTWDPVLPEGQFGDILSWMSEDVTSWLSDAEQADDAGWFDWQ